MDKKGLRQLLNSSMLAVALLTEADRIKARAEATAPTRTGTYRSSFETEARRRMGSRRDRTGAAVINTSKHARFVEYGGGDDTPGHHTLLRAATGQHGS
ncbi:HK97 gp10 family phage protein [Streptomyces luteireticuli]|uniref:HK97 gp10 family phage protein n=1 Tax=Streptomyces luteireticuli TaxID=173858 RepID=A0ABN0YZA6_9ACTN